MTSRLACPHCGHLNGMTRLFCQECGTKLDHRNVQFEGRNPRSRGAGRSPWLILRIAASIGLIGGAVLVLWPVRSSGEMGDAASGQAYRRKVALMYDACVTGKPLQVTVTEGEINRYLWGIVHHPRGQPDRGSLTHAKLEDVRMAVDRDAVNVVARVKWGPVPLAYCLSGRPEKAPGSFRMRVDQARLGLLPVPSPLAERLVVSKMRRIFQGLETETAVLRHVEVLQLGPGKVRASTDAR